MNLSINKLIRTALVWASVMACGAVTGTPVQADFTYYLTDSFNGTAPSPTTPPAWLTAEFKDSATNTVTLTLTANLGSATEFVDQFVFNVKTSITPSSLSITQSSGPNATFNTPNSQDSIDNLAGGGSEKDWDLRLNFAAAAAQRFNGTDVAVFTISRAAGLSAADFNYTNGLTGNYHVAAHIQGIPPGDSNGLYSGAIGDGPENEVPLPPTFVMLVTGLLPTLGCVRLIRRRKEQAPAA